MNLADEFDNMSQEQIAMVVLEMLGYKEELDPSRSGWWRKGNDEWHVDMVFDPQDSHAVAAEVKGVMASKGWGCNDVLQQGKFHCITFYVYSDINGPTYITGRAEYADMQDHPRAVYEAALYAMRAFREDQEER